MDIKILMICLGNICRSPMAEGIMKAKIKEHKLKWQVDSAGTSSWHAGDKPDKRAIATSKSNGVDISDQRSRAFTPADFSEINVIFVMDESNQRDIVEMALTERQGTRVKLLLEYAEMDMKSVPDPFYGEEKGFQATFDLLNDACEKALLKLKAEYAD
ncbi:MAG: low molecular weight phosphotyrosine protein phosphatase [Bacteroidetes bacterium]|nr:low molecular weight phosphotyrosine protein phosphatase [Bacteroidota bacterium]